MWNLLLGVKDLRKNPSVSLRLPAPFSREPECKRPPLKWVTPHGVGRCPQGRGDRSVRGGPSSDGGGIFLWNLLLDVSGFTEVPLSHLRCQLSTRHALRVPFQGSLFLKKRQPNKKSISHRITPVQRCSFESKSDLFCLYFAAASFSARFSQTFARSTASYKFGRSEVLVIAFTGSGSLVAI